MYEGSVLSAGKTDRSFTKQVGKCECSGAIAENRSKRFALTPEQSAFIPGGARNAGMGFEMKMQRR